MIEQHMCDQWCHNNSAASQLKCPYCQKTPCEKYFKVRFQMLDS